MIISAMGITCHQSVRAKLYHDDQISSPKGQNGEICIIHSEQDFNYFEILQKTLEGGDRRSNEKYLHRRKYKTSCQKIKFNVEEGVAANFSDLTIGCNKVLVLFTPSLLKSQWSQISFPKEKAVFIKVKLDYNQEVELNDLLQKPENRFVKQCLETKWSSQMVQWSGHLNDKEFWKSLAYLLPHEKPDSSKGVLNSLMKRIYSRRKNGSKDNNNNKLTSFEDYYKQDSENKEIGRYRDQDNNGSFKKGAIEHENNSSIKSLAHSNSSDETRINEQRQKVEDYFHGDFKAMRDSYISIINRASSDGVFLVTNIPDEEKSKGYYKHGSYVILRRGEKCSDISIWIIIERKKLYNVSGSNQQFSSLTELVQHYQENHLPNSDSILVEPLETCYRCRRCRFGEGG